MSSMAVNPLGSCGFSRSPAWISLQDSRLPGRQKQKLQGSFRPGLGSPRTSILPYSIGQSRSRVVLVQGQEIDSTLSTVCGRNGIHVQGRGWLAILFGSLLP